MEDGALQVHCFQHDPNAQASSSWVSYYWPPALVETGEQTAIPRPCRLSSLVFICSVESIEKFSFRYIFGMRWVYCVQNLANAPIVSSQSISSIILDAVGRISSELQRVMSNRHQNQSAFSVSNVPITTVMWRFFVDCFGIPVITKEKPMQSILCWSRDLSITQVKRRIACHILRLENMVAMMQFLSIFGIASVVGVRKCLPCMEQRLHPNNNNDEILTSRVCVQLLDIIYIVNVQANEILGPRPANGTFAFHGNEYKGIDLIFFLSSHQCVLVCNIAAWL